MYTERKYKVLKMCKIAAILLVSMYKHPAPGDIQTDGQQ